MKILLLLFALLSFVAGVLGIVLFHALVDAWVLTFLWAWILVPIFGMKLIGVAEAYGLMLITNFIIHKPDISKTETDENKAVIYVFFKPVFSLLLLGIGWILHTYFIKG